MPSPLTVVLINSPYVGAGGQRGRRRSSAIALGGSSSDNRFGCIRCLVVLRQGVAVPEQGRAGLGRPEIGASRRGAVPAAGAVKKPTGSRRQPSDRLERLMGSKNLYCHRHSDAVDARGCGSGAARTSAVRVVLSRGSANGTRRRSRSMGGSSLRFRSWSTLATGWRHRSGSFSWCFISTMSWVSVLLSRSRCRCALFPSYTVPSSSGPSSRPPPPADHQQAVAP